MKGATLIFLSVCLWGFRPSLSYMGKSNETVGRKTDGKASKYLYKVDNDNFDGTPPYRTERYKSNNDDDDFDVLPYHTEGYKLNNEWDDFDGVLPYHTEGFKVNNDDKNDFDGIQPYHTEGYKVNDDDDIYGVPPFYTIGFKVSPSPTPDLCNASTSESLMISRFKRSNNYRQNQTVTGGPDTVDTHVLSDEFLNCSAHTNVEPECYVLFPNGTVYVPTYRRYFDQSNYVISEGLLFVCPDFFNRVFQGGKFHPAIGIVSTVGVSVSTLFVILHILMFLLVEKLRNLPGYCLFSLCISLLIAYINFFVHLGLKEHTECKVVGMSFLYSFLSSFFWMNVISFDVWNSIRVATSQLLLPSKRSVLRKFCFYSSYAWGLPVLILVAAVIVHFSTDRVEYQLIFRKSTCWFQYKQPPMVYFVAPLFVVISLNVFFFVSSFYLIVKTRSETGSQEIHDLKSRLFLSLRLGTVMGLVWILGAIDVLSQSEWISYLQSICNGFQGAFIFFSFNFNERTRKACKDTIRRKKSSILPSMVPSQVSTNF